MSPRLELWTEELVAAELSAVGRQLRQEAALHARVDLCLAEGCELHLQPAAMRSGRSVTAHLRSTT